ncbi:MAG: cation:proton antiporter [Nitrospinota bacterium]|nr:MAG: cation:proton antiporter [Nitrospinota bacterium]
MGPWSGTFPMGSKGDGGTGIYLSGDPPVLLSGCNAYTGKREERHTMKQIWTFLLSSGIVVATAVPSFASAGGGGEGEDILLVIARLVLQIGVILIAAKVGGEICEVYLKQPGVLGELIAGMLIGPYALGGYITIPRLGPLFVLPSTGGEVTGIPVSTELYAFAQIAAVILLFMAGLETDLRQFLRYGGPATVIAVGGVITPFVLGAWTTVLFGFAPSFMHPTALFMGAIMTATSVGITARVLSDIGRLDTPEGVSILAAAVVDDVLGILVLAMVVSISREGAVSLGALGMIGAKAFGFWIGLTAAVILLSRYIERFLNAFVSKGATLALALALCFVAAATAELFGLAMIIGAYAMGLGLSEREIAHRLEKALAPIYAFMVPVFFAVMGMLVNFHAMQGALMFGLVLSFLGVISKIFGCGLPALAVGFNRVGGFRIGIGMLPRGEVALIVAGVGLSASVINSAEFGVAIMMTLITTLIAPIVLVPAFQRGGEGTRRARQQNMVQEAIPREAD